MSELTDKQFAIRSIGLLALGYLAIYASKEAIIKASQAVGDHVSESVDNATPGLADAPSDWSSWEQWKNFLFAGLPGVPIQQKKLNDTNIKQGWAE